MKNEKLIKQVVIGVIAVSTLSLMTNASAAAPTGICGMEASIPRPDLDYALTANKTKNMDILAEINFTTNTINFSLTQFVFTTAGTPPVKQNVGGSATFTMKGPGLTNVTATGYTVAGQDTPLPDAYQITFDPFGLGNPTILNVLPVNSGNTYLIQGIADRISGVCQKF